MQKDDLIPNRFYEFLIILAVLAGFGVYALVSKADAGLVAAVLGPIVAFASSHTVIGHWSDHKVKTTMIESRAELPELAAEIPTEPGIPILPPVDVPGPKAAS